MDRNIQHTSEARSKARRTSRYDREFKIHVMIEHLCNGVRKQELRQRYAIHKDTFSSWKKQFIDAGKLRFRMNDFRYDMGEKLRQAMAENASLKKEFSTLRPKYMVLQLFHKHGIRIQKRKVYPAASARCL